MFRIFWQVWLGEIGKKDVRNAKKNNKKINSKQWNLWRILDFKYLYFLEKCSMIFQKSLIKTVIHKIKTHKNFQNFLTSIDRRNWKETFKSNNKIKNKQIVNCEILKKNYFTYLPFCKRTFRNSKNSLIKSLIHWKKHYKKFHKKCSYLRLVSIFGIFSCLGSCAFVLSIF